LGLSPFVAVSTSITVISKPVLLVPLTALLLSKYQLIF
jgi:hypothetical protein